MLEDAIRTAGDNMDSYGRPVKGKIKNLVLNATNDGWKPTVQYWFVERWNQCERVDPVQCIVDVLAMPIDDRPRPRGIQPYEAIPADDNDLDDLLV